MISILAFIVMVSLHVTSGFDRKAGHHHGFVAKHRHSRLIRDIKGSGSIAFRLPPQHVADLQTSANPPFASEYRNYTNASVTTDTTICSNIGVTLLRDKGGSVVDAAIAVSLCVGIVNAQSCGIGGGHFATIYERPKGSSEKILVAVIARTTAPGSSNQNMFVNKTGTSSLGGLAVAVPGEISGYYEAWKKFGRLPWKDLFQPVIGLCEDGFKVEKALSNAIKNYERYIRNDTYLSELFVKPDNALVKEGDLLKNPKLAKTFRRIADDPFTFYNGTLAEDIIEDLREHGSIITLDDLSNYRSLLKAPVNVSLTNGRYTVFNPPPPASGAVFDFIVNILDGYNFSSAQVADVNSTVLAYHRIIEAFKFAYAKRSLLGDEDFVNVSKLVYNLTSDNYAEEIRSQIDDDVTHSINYYGPNFAIKTDAGTAHMNILAADGSAIALTSSINLYFGAKFRGNRTGIIFNDDMDDFSTPGTFNYFGVPASPTNYIEPGKRPMSSMSPSLFLDERGRVVLISGASGGTIITTSTAFTAVNSLWFDKNLRNATDTARVHHQLAPNTVMIESWFDKAIADGLRAKNHSVQVSSDFAVVGSIRNRCSQPGNNQDACIEAVSDGRKGGLPDGYANSLPPPATTPKSANSGIRVITNAYLMIILLTTSVYQWRAGLQNVDLGSPGNC